MQEGAPTPPQREISTIEIKEKIFADKIISRLIDTFTEALYESEYDQQKIDDIKKELENHSEEEIKGAIAIPIENAERYLGALKDKSSKEVVDTLISNSRRYGFTIGYHVSSSDIRNGHIEGKEKDHRDNDLPMAYYSLRYKDLYLRKQGRYLYVIRAETGENSTHRKDNDGSWGRAASLAVIDRLDLNEIRHDVESSARRYEAERNKAAN